MADFKRDRFNNPIDPVVGFARGKILASSVDEARRLRHGQAVAANRVRERGPHSIGIFTGNQRDFPVTAEDLATVCEEWIGPGLIAEQLRSVAISHMGGRADDRAAVFNRTSAGIVATIAAHAKALPVVSIVPEGGRSHASVVRGCGLARAELVEIQASGEWTQSAPKQPTALVVITTITSSLERLDDSTIEAAVKYARDRKALCFLDDAYGARLRPVLHGGRKALAFDADIAITNCDKAGLSGPRAGVLVGRDAMVTAAAAKGAEYGMEARAPIAAGALRSLQGFADDHLRKEAAAGQTLTTALKACLTQATIVASDLGPMIHEDDLLAELLRRAGKSATQTVPAEAAAALGMVLLRDHGILTVNTHGQPGARVSLRLKPTLTALSNVGGASGVVSAVDAALDAIAAIVTDATALRRLVVGEAA